MLKGKGAEIMHTWNNGIVFSMKKKIKASKSKKQNISNIPITSYAVNSNDTFRNHRDQTCCCENTFFLLFYCENISLNMTVYVITFNRPVSQYERPRAVALASSACVEKNTKIITEFTRKDPFLHMKQAN